MRRISYKIILLSILMLFLCGCGGSNEVKGEGEYYLYYTNLEVTGLLTEVYKAEGTEAEALIPELLEALNREPEDTSHFMLLSDAVQVEDYTYTGNQVVLNMSKAYQDMPKVKEVLVRAGLVRTLVQIEGVDTVQICIAGVPLKDSKGNEIGAMTEKTFIENSGKEINTYKSKTITLYFANAEGTRLVSEKRSLYYSSNTPIEQVIVEQLIKGPKTEGHYATLPSAVNVLNVTVVDNICYVNLSKSFMDSALAVQQEIPIYSISQSLIENCDVEKVQIAIEGESELVFRESMKLKNFYGKNNTLIQEES